MITPLHDVLTLQGAMFSIQYSCVIFQDFGSIFTTLLPGTQAKLMPPEGRGVLDGLEVKVAFGDVWKESLSELSGGQRSVHIQFDISNKTKREENLDFERDFIYSLHILP